MAEAQCEYDEWNERFSRTYERYRAHRDARRRAKGLPIDAELEQEFPHPTIEGL
jgi:hypothetical protein